MAVDWPKTNRQQRERLDQGHPGFPTARLRASFGPEIRWTGRKWEHDL
jgi:hypothetical protein